jgi:hypothetical protein
VPISPRIRSCGSSGTPQGYGSPNIPGNSAQTYYPGDAFVDVVGNDLYNIGFKAEWRAAERLYRAHPSKPYAFPEWGNWGIDDPAFVQKMAAWVRSRRRVELLAWLESRAGSIFDLASKPRSLARLPAVHRAAGVVGAAPRRAPRLVFTGTVPC